MIDEILVKNSDDITVIKKTKEDNSISNKNLDAKIYKIDKEIETRLENIKTQLDDRTTFDKENIDEAKDEKHNDIKCNYFNKGFCKMKETCLFKHKSTTICKDHLASQKCSKKECDKRHPKTCRYFLRGSCWRRDNCSYLYAYSVQRADNLDSIDDRLDIEKVNDVEEDMMIEEMNDANGSVPSAMCQCLC